MEEAAEVCFVNIGPRQRRRRLVMGVVFLALGTGLAAWLASRGASLPARLGLFLPFFASGVGFFQWREKT